ncbi:MAG: hypothetical protein FWE30_04100 [Bacteroidales bacterium]|nr:hypothetical protein [Bacteroidales bacterium]MCL2738611.1 hypothetical protein [Bacteroidales bacterium]
MASRFSFFRTPTHRVFAYQPIYYDPEKEKREKRAVQLRAIKEEEMRQKGIPVPSDTGADPRTREERLHYPGKRIRGSFRRALYENRRHAGDNRFLRIVAVLSIAALLVLLLYFADAIGLLFRALYNTPAP